jgi:hypothetical protein
MLCLAGSPALAVDTMNHAGSPDHFRPPLLMADQAALTGSRCLPTQVNTPTSQLM